jgi:thymidylate synthase
MKSIYVTGESLPYVWEEAVCRCWEEGDALKTQYDNPGDPPSRDCTMFMHVTKPTSEPRYHRGVVMGMNDVEKYVQEVILGVHDHWMDDKSNPNRWTYTYHQRFFGYKVPNLPSRLVVPPYQVVNQIGKVIEQLKACGHTRRAQAITWQPWYDSDHHDPPCLQSAWFRVQDYEDGVRKLNMNVRFRSNDLFKAAFPNMAALVALQEMVAKEVGVEVGDYMHISDSMHIYGKDFAQVERFFDALSKRSFAERVYSTKDVAYQFMVGCDELLAEEGMPKKLLSEITERRNMWAAMVE